MDILPYSVRYKAGSDKTIQPGLHGRFATKEEAEVQMLKCAKHFGVVKRTPEGFMVGRAIIGIVADHALLEKQEAEAHGPDILAEVEAPVWVDETELLRQEIARLKAKCGEDQECAESFDSESDETQKPAKSRKSRPTSLTAAE